MQINNCLNNLYGYEDHQNQVNESKRLKGAESIESTSLGYFPREIWKQIFTCADYQTYQQLSVCNSTFRKIYMDLNGNAIVYIESRLEKIRQISKILWISEARNIKNFTTSIQEIINSTLSKWINYNQLQECFEKKKNSIASAGIHIVKFITKVDQSIEDVVSKATSGFIKIIKQINILESSYINDFLINLTESQIANLIDFFERNRRDLEKIKLYCDLRLMRACLTNNTEQFKDILKELESQFCLTADRLKPYIMTAWQKADKQIIEIITKSTENENLNLIEDNGVFLSNMDLNYEENLVEDQLNILDSLLSHKNMNLYFKNNNANFSLIFKNFPFEIKKQIFHKYFEQLGFITDKNFIGFHKSKDVDQDFLQFYLEDSRINHKEADREAFFNTCKFGSVKTLETLLNYSTFAFHFNFNQGFKDACLIGNIETIRFLSTHPNVTQKNEAFVEACKQKNTDSVEVVKFLLTLSDIDPTYQNNQAFIEACKEGNLDIVKLLLALPNINPADQNNQAFIEACKSGLIELVKLLLALPNVNPADQSNKAFIAAYLSNRNKVILKILSQDKRVNPFI